MEILYIVNIVLLAASLVLVNVTIKRVAERLDDEEDTRIDEVAALAEAVAGLEKRAAALEADAAKLKEQVDSIPVDQIQSVYDSERQFQDGLSAIMNYFGPAQGERDR